MSSTKFWVITSIVATVTISLPVTAMHYFSGDSAGMVLVSGYGGAVIGGLIGSFSTFLGIRITLNQQDRLREIENFPRKLQLLNSLIDSTHDSIRGIQTAIFDSSIDLMESSIAGLDAAVGEVGSRLYIRTRLHMTMLIGSLDKYRKNPLFNHREFNRFGNVVRSAEGDELHSEFKDEMSAYLDRLIGDFKKYRSEYQTRFYNLIK